MLYIRKPMDVDAIQLQRQMELNGKVGQAGDYIVTFADGSITIMTAAVFQGNFIPASADARILKSPAAVLEVTPPAIEPKPTGYVCVGCGDETVPGSHYDKNTGMCADCLKLETTCPNCGSTIKQYERVGSYCRKCLTNLAR